MTVPWGALTCPIAEGPLMAKHKAPTSITIASTTDRTALHLFVERNWKTALVAVVAVTLTIIVRQCISLQTQASAAGSWDRLLADVSFGGGRIGDGTGQLRGFSNPAAVVFPEASVLAQLSDELADDPAGPWAKALEIGGLLRREDYAGAKAALAELQERWPDHPVASQLFPFDEDGEPQTLSDFVEARLREIETWEATHPLLFANPPLPEGSPKVRLHTGAGEILLGLYRDEAPQHVANFLTLCSEGFYDNTRFHRVVPNELIQGGDPNSIAGEEETWGLGDAGYTVASEPNGLRHFPHVLAMAKKGGDVDSSGCQFYVTVAKRHDLDERYVVFGTVLEGAFVVDTIAASPLKSHERPETAVLVESTEIVSE